MRLSPGRLPGGKAFDRVFREGSAVGGPFLAFRWAPRDDGNDGPARIGYAVGKRIAPHAVDRNRLRRKLRAIAREQGMVEGADVVVLAREKALSAGREDLMKAWELGLRKLEEAGR